MVVIPSSPASSPGAVEDQNFALFNYVNELSGDIELVQEQIQEVRTTGLPTYTM